MRNMGITCILGLDYLKYIGTKVSFLEMSNAFKNMDECAIMQEEKVVKWEHRHWKSMRKCN